MHAKLKTPLDTMAIIDKTNRKADVVDVNCIFIEALQIFRPNHLAQIAFRIGGVDSKGAFFGSHDYDDKVARMNIEDPLFTELFLDSNGNIKCNIDEEVFKVIFEQCITSGDKLIWNFPINTQVVLTDYSKAKPNVEIMVLDKTTKAKY